MKDQKFKKLLYVSEEKKVEKMSEKIFFERYDYMFFLGKVFEIFDEIRKGFEIAS